MTMHYDVWALDKLNISEVCNDDNIMTAHTQIFLGLLTTSCHGRVKDTANAKDSEYAADHARHG